MSAFATVADIETLWRPLSTDEEARAEAMLPLLSDALRVEANAYGKDLDAEAESDATFASVLKLVTVDITCRVLRQSTEGDALTQESQSALGYSWSGTYAVPGGGIAGAIMFKDLKRLGIGVQTAGVVEMG